MNSKANLDSIGYNDVQKTVWVSKSNPKEWCPSEHQILNYFGRCVLSVLNFSMPQYFPPIKDLANFGYVIIGTSVQFNLKACKDAGKASDLRKMLKDLIKKPKRSGKPKRLQNRAPALRKSIGKNCRKKSTAVNLID